MYGFVVLQTYIGYYMHYIRILYIDICCFDMVLFYYRRMLDIICTTYVYCILLYVQIYKAIHTYIVYYIYKYVRVHTRMMAIGQRRFLF